MVGIAEITKWQSELQKQLDWQSPERLRIAAELWTDDLLSTVKKVQDEDEALQRRTGHNFSVLSVVLRSSEETKITERKLSDILAFLLSPTEAHGQGTLFLRTFLLGLGHPIPAHDLAGSDVKTESQTILIDRNRRMVDIAIEGNNFVFFIENKPTAMLQPDQIPDYVREGLERANRLGTTLFRLIYLFGGEAQHRQAQNHFSDKHVLLMSYRKNDLYPSLEEWLDNVAAEVGAEAHYLRGFLNDVNKWIQTKFGEPHWEKET